MTFQATFTKTSVMELIHHEKKMSMQLLIATIVQSLLTAKAKLVFGGISGSISALFLFLTMPDLEGWVKISAAIVAALIVPVAKVIMDVKKQKQALVFEAEKHRLSMDRDKEAKFKEMLHLLKEEGVIKEGMTLNEVLEIVKKYSDLI